MDVYFQELKCDSCSLNQAYVYTNHESIVIVEWTQWLCMERIFQSFSNHLHAIETLFIIIRTLMR